MRYTPPIVADAKDIWAAKSDEALLEASEQLSEFTEEGGRIIRDELRRRLKEFQESRRGHEQRHGETGNTLADSQRRQTGCVHATWPFESRTFARTYGSEPLNAYTAGLARDSNSTSP